MKITSSKEFLLYLTRFGIIFSILYFGTLGIIGLSSKEGYYSPFVANYLDYTVLLRKTLLYTTDFLLGFFGYRTFFFDQYTLAVVNGGAVRMVYSCLGYGVLSFWAAFVIANSGQFTKKLAWVIVGGISLWLLNVMRIFLLILALTKNWRLPLGIDHHTWFTIFAYALIFLLIYFYDRSKKKSTGSLQP